MGEAKNLDKESLQDSVDAIESGNIKLNMDKIFLTLLMLKCWVIGLIDLQLKQIIEILKALFMFMMTKL